jgi:CelD/BcsL family acetyltransferase involved in cellulose biosynthesis
MQPQESLAWLGPRDVDEMTRVASRAASVPKAMGGKAWPQSLADAEASSHNLSIGLRIGRRLRAFVLAWRVPAADGPDVVRIAAVGAEPGSAGTQRLFAALCRTLLSAPDLRSAVLEAHVSPELYADFMAGSMISPIGPTIDTEATGTIRARLIDPPRSTPGGTLGERLRERREYVIDGRDVEVALCSTASDWSALEPYWDGLLAVTPGGGATQGYAYLRAWWRHLGPPEGLWIAVVIEAGRPVAIAPMQKCVVSSPGSTRRPIRFLGAGAEVDKPVVLAPPDAAWCGVALARYLLDRRDEWDRLELKEQTAASHVTPVLARELAHHGYLVSRGVGPLSIVAERATDWPAYLAARDRSLRRNLKRRRRQLDASGDVTVEGPTSEQAELSLERYVALERRSWKAAADAAAVGADPRRAAFYRALAATPATAEQLRFTFLNVGGTPIAATFGLSWRRRYQSLHICHARQWSTHSPGALLTAFELERAHEQGDCDAYDFLCGFEAAKLPWATHVQQTVHLVVDRSSTRRRVLNWLQFGLRPRVKHWLVRTGLQSRALRVKSRLATRFTREGA